MFVLENGAVTNTSMFTVCEEFTILNFTMPQKVDVTGAYEFF